MLGPQTVVGSGVKNKFAARSGAVQRGGVAEIPGDAFDFQFADFARGAAQRTDAMAPLYQRAGDMPAQESAGACN